MNNKTNKKTTSLTIKTMLFDSLIVAMVIPVSAMALENKPLTVEEELTVAQSHYDKLYAANIEKLDIESDNSSYVFATEQAKTERIAQIDIVIDNETRVLEELEVQRQKKYALEPNFKVDYTRAKEILRDTLTSDEVPYLGMSLGGDRQSIKIAIDSLRLTTEKDQQYYEEYLKSEYAEISYPIEIIFKAHPR